MRIGRLPLDEQIATLRAILSRNEWIPAILDRAARLDAPGWYLAAGCLVQTIWNVVTDCPPDRGIKDYDLIYCDDSDLSWEAEDRVIRAAATAFADLPVTVEVRNEARVHLWYEGRFGIPCAPLRSTEAAIDTFPACACCLGVRLLPDGRWSVYAPHGLADAFNLVIRPNPVLAPREVYEAKTARWVAQWPGLTVLAWPRSDIDSP